MNCDTALELISASLDGELTAQEEAALRAHLAQCPSCRTLMTELTGIHRACSPALEAECPPALKDAVMDRLPPQSSGAVRPWRRWGALAASLVLVALAVWSLPRFLPDRTTSDSIQEAVANAAASEGDAVYGKTEDALQTEAAAGGADAGGVILYGGASGEQDASKFDRAAEAAPASLEDLSKTAADPLDATPAPAAEAQNGSGSTPRSGVRGRSFFDVGDPAEPQGENEDVIETEDASVSGAAESAPASEIPEPDPDPDPSATDTPELEEIIEVPDAFPAYRGVLTLPQGRPMGDYPAQVQADGAIWYALPADDFDALLRELDAEGASYDLRLTGEDISATAPYGLLVVAQ